MAHRSDRDLFTSVRTEGAILPPDLLQRVLGLDRDLPGLTPEAYHLDLGESLGEATSRAWQRLQGIWTAFKAARDKLPPGDTGTTIARQRWLLPLFQELGYGRLTQTPSIRLDGLDFPIFSNWGGRVPIHLVGCNVDLDTRTAGIRGAAKVSPHGLVQDLLNRSDDYLWGFASNGLLLRLLRDSFSLTRLSYVQLDLEAMFEGGAYSDFALLWMVCHQSRVEAEKPEQFYLEQWSKLAHEEGTRALENLRAGVEAAITALGQGFLAHPANNALRERLRTGTLSTQDYYRQLLRYAYRLIFLFVAEDRNLLHPADADPKARDLYQRYYSTKRLRLLASRRRGTRHSDLIAALRLVMDKLGSDNGCPELGLPALGSFLWSPQAVSDLHGASLPNEYLLNALRALALSTDGGALRPVDFKNLGAEELGSVYESLLELHPQLHLEAAEFKLDNAPGHERKTTGSYYTPESLIQCLLDSALDPVLDEAAKKPNPEQAILDLKVCDPACGSGHFLIGAAHRIAKRLASARTGDDEPSPEAVRKALREVIGRCLYGVDINPMSVELCKVALWMEALEPGKPLSFLDHHIRCGNSLLGTTPALMAEGIPDEAFTPIEGDDKEACKQLKRQNKLEREAFSNPDLWASEAEATYEALETQARALSALTDESLGAIKEKERRFGHLEGSEAYIRARLAADAWCATFVWKKNMGTDGRVAGPKPITHDVLVSLQEDPSKVPTDTIQEIERLAAQYCFFHWHLAFPEVFRVPKSCEQPENEQAGLSDGFDVMLGNPPWERPKPEPAKYFASIRPEISLAQTSAKRAALLQELEYDNHLVFTSWKEYERSVMAAVSFITASGMYPLSAVGKFNLGNIFMELSRSFIKSCGRSGMLNVSGMATDDSGKGFMADLLQTHSIVSLYDFENREGLFVGVHRSYKFSAVTLTGRRSPATSGDFVFFAHRVEDLLDQERHICLSAENIRLINPLSGNCPIFRERPQAELVSLLYRKAKLRKPPADVLYDWDAEPTFLFVMSDHSNLFHTQSDLGFTGIAPGSVLREIEGEQYLPLYESKMFHQFEHRWAHVTPEDGQIDVTVGERQNAAVPAIPRYWMRSLDTLAKLNSHQHSWLLGIREVTNSTNERTTIAAVLPFFPVGHNAQVFRFRPDAISAASFVSNLNAFVFDFVARCKVGGSHLSSFILRQLPILPEADFSLPCIWSRGNKTIRDWLVRPVLELVFTAWDLEPFARDCGYSGPPFHWDEERRFLMRCELDAAFFHLYLGADEEWQKEPRELLAYFPTPRRAADYILDAFPIVRRKDEARHGSYRTKDTILEIYDAMAEAIHTGVPYQTRLDPPPADPRCAHDPSTRPAWVDLLYQKPEQVQLIAAPLAHKEPEALPFNHPAARPIQPTIFPEAQPVLVFDQPAGLEPMAVPAGGSGSEKPTEASGASPTDRHVAVLCRILDFHRGTKYERTLGSVKAEKTSHVVESHAETDLGRIPVRAAAGPVDFRHLNKVVHRAARLFAFDWKQRHGVEGHEFFSLSGFNKRLNLSEQVLGSKLTEVDRIINLFLPMDSERAEIVATLYACWNDFLTKEATPTDEQIIVDFYAWHEGKSRIERWRLESALKWMRDNSLVPRGTGKITAPIPPTPPTPPRERRHKSSLDLAVYNQLKALLQERDTIISADAQAATGLDAAGVRPYLQQLIQDGLAVMEGQRRGARYRRSVGPWEDPH